MRQILSFYVWCEDIYLSIGILLPIWEEATFYDGSHLSLGHKQLLSARLDTNQHF